MRFALGLALLLTAGALVAQNPPAAPDSDKVLRQVIEQWKDAWLTRERGDSRKSGWLHTSIEDSGEDLIIRQEIWMSREGEKGVAVCEAEAVCKRDEFLTPVSAKCTTRFDGQKVMEAALEFSPKKMKATGRVFRDRHADMKELDPPRIVERECEVPEHVILMTTMFPAFSLWGARGREAEFTLVEFPDDIDNPVNPKPGKMGFQGNMKVETEGGMVEAFKYETRWVKWFFVNREGKMVASEFKWITEAEAKKMTEGN